MQYISSSPKLLHRLVLPVVWLSCAFLMISVLSVGNGHEAIAQSQNVAPNVKLSARSLFEGHFKYGDWLPIEATLENYGAAVDVQVQVSVVTRVSGSSYTTSYRREVSLGERANKKVLLYITPYVETSNPSRSVVYDTSVMLMAGDRKLDEQKVKLQPNQPTDYLVGVVSPDPNALTGLNNLKIGGQRYIVTSLGLGLNDIPDLSNGLHSFNTLVISQISTESLSSEQRTALREWVEAGGQLVLLGGNGWPRVRSAFSDSQLLPIEVSGYSNVSNLKGLISPNGDEIQSATPLSRPTSVARAQVTKDARMLSYLPDGANVIPIAAQKAIGAGRVVAVTLDLAQSPLTDWSGTNEFWQDLFMFNLPVPLPLYTETNPQVKNASDMLGFVSNVNDLHLLDITPFFSLIGVYLLLIVPFNYLILKKIGRLEWGWLTIPAFGVVFTFLALNFVNTQPPGQVLISQISVVQSAADQQSAQVRSYAAIFSSEDRKYTVSAAPSVEQKKLLITTLNRVTSTTTDESVRPIYEGDHARLENFQIGQWGAQSFSVETQLPGQAYQISANLHFEDNSIVGTVRNNTGSPVRSAMLVLGDQVMKLQDVIEEGEVVPVNFALPQPTAASPAYCTTFTSNASFNIGSPSDKLANLLQQDHRDDKALSNRAGFLRKIYESGRYSPLNPERGLDLVGWMDQNPLPMEVDGVVSESKSSQVLISRLPISLETGNGDGHLLIPSMAFWPEGATSSTGQPPFSSRTDRTDQLCVAPHSNVTVEFQLPGGQGSINVKRLTLYINSFSTTGGRRDPTLADKIEIYNFQTKNWETAFTELKNSAQPVLTGNTFSVVPTPQKNILNDAGRFADPNTGRILLRVSANNTGIFMQHGLEVEGTRN